MLTLRQPVVHFFVCDSGNAKVNAYSEQFVQILVAHGIHVFTEKYPSHQPGYQVRAAAMHSEADFFFQIHSKTAGSGQVRLYIAGQPKRMSMDEAVARVWEMWRTSSGALTQEEVDCLSAERIMKLLEAVAGLTPDCIDLQGVQKQAGEVVATNGNSNTLMERLNNMENALSIGKTKIGNMRPMSSAWVNEQGSQLSRCLVMPNIIGLSPPLRGILNNIVDQTRQKVCSIKRIMEDYYNEEAEQPIEDDVAEIPVGYDGLDTVPSWNMMVESYGDELGSLHYIASSGHDKGNGSFGSQYFLDALEGY